MDFVFQIHFLAKDRTVNMFFKLETPANFLIAGCSQSGKSTWVRRLIENRRELFKVVPEEVLYVYSTWQPLFKELEQIGVKFQNTLPTQSELMEWSEPPSHRLLILDDVMTTACVSSDILTLFTVTAHHRNISSLILLQTIFPPFAYSRCLSLNAHYIVLFRALRDRLQIQSIGSQMFPGQADFWKASYSDATSRPYGYIFVSCHPAGHPEFRVITRIFPDEITWVYTPIKAGELPTTKSVEL